MVKIRRIIPTFILGFCHPEVYILIIPGFSLISYIIISAARKLLFSYFKIIYAMFLIKVFRC